MNMKEKAMKTLTIGAILSGLALASCGGGGGGGGGNEAEEQLENPVDVSKEKPDVWSKLPVDRSEIDSIRPFGFIGSKSTTPQDSMVFQLKKVAGQLTAVRAPGSGKVKAVIPRAKTHDYDIEVEMSQTHSYYLSAIMDPTVALGAEVSAGQILGATAQTSQSLRVLELDAGKGEAKAVDPATFFDEATSAEIQSLLPAK